MKYNHKEKTVENDNGCIFCIENLIEGYNKKMTKKEIIEKLKIVFDTQDNF